MFSKNEFIRIILKINNTNELNPFRRSYIDIKNKYEHMRNIKSFSYVHGPGKKNSCVHGVDLPF